MRLIFFGSGEFGFPTLRRLSAAHEVALIVTQPDRPAGRNRRNRPSAVATFAHGNGFETIKPEHVNGVDAVERIRSIPVDAFVVIAYGQKLGSALLTDRFAINLHGSLLPKYRGAAPVNWAVINGEKETGLSVITLAERMDAGDILGQTMTPIDPMETAGELHDRLAALGPELVSEVLQRYLDGRLTRQKQDKSKATLAPKLTKGAGTVLFDQPAEAVRARVHGLTPWPGCRVLLGERLLRLHRVEVAAVGGPDESAAVEIGTIIKGNCVRCSPGFIRLMAVQPAGRTLMSFSAYRAGHPVADGDRLLPIAGK